MALRDILEGRAARVGLLDEPDDGDGRRRVGLFGIDAYILLDDTTTAAVAAAAAVPLLVPQLLLLLVGTVALLVILARRDEAVVVDLRVGLLVGLLEDVRRLIGLGGDVIGTELIDADDDA